MSALPAPVTKHLATAKEHLAGIKAAQKWHQELAAAHLLALQSPIRDEPYGATAPPPAS